jgi:hypothetical protein
VDGRLHGVAESQLSSYGPAVYGLLVCAICRLMPAVLIVLLSKESAIIAEGQTALRLPVLSYPLPGYPAGQESSRPGNPGGCFWDSPGNGYGPWNVRLLLLLPLR